MPKASYKKRADGRFVVYYHGKAFYGKTATEAEKKRAAYIKDEAAGMRAAAANVTFYEYASQWLPVYRAECTPATYNQYAGFIEQACKTLGSKRVKDITPTQVQTLFNSVRGMSDSHIGKFCGTIRALFRAAYADGICNRDPAANAKKPSGVTGTHRPLTPDEVRRIVATAPTHPFGAVMMIMLYTGARRGEAIAINIDEDVDFVARTVTIRRAVSYAYGDPVFSDGKTAAAQRTVPLLKPLADFLQGRHGFACEDALMPKATLQARARSFNAAAGIDVRMHDLRHNYCVWLFDAGVDMKAAQTWMGHSDASMIMRIYDHLSEERRKRSISALENIVLRVSDGQNDGQIMQALPGSLDNQGLADL